MALKSVQGNVWFGLIVLVVGLLAMSTIYSMYPNLKKESFISGGYPTSQLCKMPLTTSSPQSIGPADAALNSPRDPYHLLGDYMPKADERIANLTSECAYIADGQRRIEQTGSYRQITNNYKKKNPDNGSTWLHELSVSFYK